MDGKVALKQFLERLQTDSALRKELGGDPEGVVARETGMTAAELEQHMSQLTDEELAAVAGGEIEVPFFKEKCRYCGKWFSGFLITEVRAAHEVWCDKRPL